MPNNETREKIMKMPEPYRACWCRAPAITGPDGKRVKGRLLGKSCPMLRDSKHGSWYARYEAPADAEGRRQQIRIGPWATRGEAKAALVEALGQVTAGTHPADRTTRLGEYLDKWLAWHETEVKPSTLTSYREAFSLYWKPALGHVKLGDLRESDIRDTLAAMRRLNTPEEPIDRSDLLRRLAAARGTWHGQRFRRAPLSEARIRRVTAPLVAALGDCKALPVNPAKGVSAARSAAPASCCGPMRGWTSGAEMAAVPPPSWCGHGTSAGPTSTRSRPTGSMPCST
jgi:Phage integrase, N-terminal SAM-like domain